MANAAEVSLHPGGNPDNIPLEMVEVQIQLLGGEPVTLLASPGERLGKLGCRLLSETKHHAAARSRVRFMSEETMFTPSTCVQDLPSKSLTAVLEPMRRVHVMSMGEPASGSVDASSRLSFEGEDRVANLYGSASDSDEEGDKKGSGQFCRGVSYLDMFVKYAHEDEDCLEISMCQGCNSSYTIALLNEAEFGTDLEVRVLAGGESGIRVGLMTQAEFDQTTAEVAHSTGSPERAVEFAVNDSLSEECVLGVGRLRLVDLQGTATLFRGQEAQVPFPPKCHWYVAAEGHDGDFGAPLIAIKLLASDV